MLSCLTFELWYITRGRERVCVGGGCERVPSSELLDRPCVSMTISRAPFRDMDKVKWSEKTFFLKPRILKKKILPSKLAGGQTELISGDNFTFV